MTPTELQLYLREQIPLSRAMDVSVVSATADSVVLSAPLAPNINHRQTAFGGSMSALAILSAWALLLTRLKSDGLAARLVIQRNSMEYEQPVQGEFAARSSLQDPEQWQQFSRMLTRKGRGRISVVAVLESAGQVAGRFTGEFVALGA